MTASHYTNIREYLLTLATPREELQGHAICPYIDQYIDHITTSTHQSRDTVLAHVPTVIQSHTPAHVFECDFAWDWFDMESTMDMLHHLYKQDDTEFLFMHPDSEDAPLAIGDYNYHIPLIILQQRSVLKRARNELAKNTNYYHTFNKLK